MSSKLLINESPLQLLPSLAKAIGLNEAIILQQIQYWIVNPKIGKVHEGRRYVRNSVREWHETNFPWWSERTIKRVLQNLVDDELVLTANLNKYQNDRTLWYTINYERLEELTDSIMTDCHNGKGQSVTMDHDKLSQPLPETLSENEQRVAARPRERTDAHSAFENHIHLTPSENISNQIFKAVNRYGEKTVIDAIIEGGQSGGNSWNYVDTILGRWEREGRNNGQDPRKALLAEVDAYAKRDKAFNEITLQAQQIVREMGGESYIRSLGEDQFRINFYQTVNKNG